MTTDDSPLIRVIWFVLAMFLIVELPHACALPFLGTPFYDLIGGVLSILSLPLMYLAVVLSLRAEGGGSVADVGLDLADRHLMSSLGIGLLSGALASGLVAVVALLFGGQLRDPATINVDLVISVALIAFIVAILEELCYRGYLLTRMEMVWNRRTAILLGSLVFALVHFNWYTPLGTVPPLQILLFSANMFVGGVVLALSFYWFKKSLWVPIGFHFSWNVLAYSLFPIYPDVNVYLPEIFQIEWGVVSIVGFLFGLSIVWLLYSLIKENK